jgi:hypothetical protein
MSKTKPAAAGAFAAATAALGAGVDAIFDQEGPLVSDLMLDMIDLSEQVRSEFEDEDNTLKELAEASRPTASCSRFWFARAGTGINWWLASGATARPSWQANPRSRPTSVKSRTPSSRTCSSPRTSSART